MKNLKKNGIFLAILTFVILFLVLKDDFKSIIELLKNISIPLLIGACFLEFLVFIFESLAFDQIIKSYNSEHSFKNTFRLTLITKFFNGITPFSTGGQPMQIHYLKKEGFRLTKATNIVVQNFILYQLALISIGTLAIILNFFFDYFPNNPFLRYLVILGFFINTSVMVVSFIISFSKKFNKFFINLGLDILTKLKLLKNKDEQKAKWEERCNDFHEGATYIKEHKSLCIKGYLYNIIALLCLYAIPYILFYSLDSQVTVYIVPILVASSYVQIIGSFVPIPGASGGIEYGFLEFFNNFVSGSLLSATLLIYRTITYYLPLVIGAVVLNIKKGD